MGRLTGVAFGGGVQDAYQDTYNYMYVYNPAGRVTEQIMNVLHGLCYCYRPSPWPATHLGSILQSAGGDGARPKLLRPPPDSGGCNLAAGFTTDGRQHGHRPPRVQIANLDARHELGPPDA